MNRIAASGPVIEGIDVYHGNSNPDFSLCAFAYLKATEGTSVTDATFQGRWRLLKSLGVARGAYHFFHPGQNPVLQAQHFAGTVGELEPNDLPPALDVEVLDGQSAEEAGKAVVQCLGAIKGLTGRHAVVYGSPYFLEALKLPKGMPNALWVAHYTEPAPMVPAPWSDWSFWQFSDSSGVDRDRFNGDLLSLERLVDRSKQA